MFACALVLALVPTADQDAVDGSGAASLQKITKIFAAAASCIGKSSADLVKLTGDPTQASPAAFTYFLSENVNTGYSYKTWAIRQVDVNFNAQSKIDSVRLQVRFPKATFLSEFWRDINGDPGGPTWAAASRLQIEQYASDGTKPGDSNGLFYIQLKGKLKTGSPIWISNVRSLFPPVEVKRKLDTTTNTFSYSEPTLNSNFKAYWPSVRLDPGIGDVSVWAGNYPPPYENDLYVTNVPPYDPEEEHRQLMKEAAAIRAARATKASKVKPASKIVTKPSKPKSPKKSSSTSKPTAKRPTVKKP